MLAGIETVVTGGLTLIVYALILFAVYKIFQISSDVGEMKEVLKDIRRNTAPGESSARAPGMHTAVSSHPESAEALVRAVHTASYQEIDDVIRDPK